MTYLHTPRKLKQKHIHNTKSTQNQLNASESRAQPWSHHLHSTKLGRIRCIVLKEVRKIGHTDTDTGTLPSCAILLIFHQQDNFSMKQCMWLMRPCSKCQHVLALAAEYAKAITEINCQTSLAGFLLEFKHGKGQQSGCYVTLAGICTPPPPNWFTN